MNQPDNSMTFTATLQQPASPPDGEDWAFLVLPREVSKGLPRRGRTSVEGTLNGAAFKQTLEPDGQLSHWLKVDRPLAEAAKADTGDTVTVAIRPVAEEPEPELPTDFAAALDAHPEALASWQATTTLARLDWIHWIESGKQKKTRATRIGKACDKLVSGKRRVCCFDPSGYYSKSLSAPEAK